MTDPRVPADRRAPTGDEPPYVDRRRVERIGRPVDEDAPFADDPTSPADGLDPGDEGRRPPAPRHHGGVIDPAHPDYFTTGHRSLPDPTDPLDQPERRLVVDDHASRTTGAAGVTQPQAPVPDPSGDPRRDLPVAEPDST
ncbi:MAG TPA: hypothetical protein VFY23_15100 [Candidatus Limnocylindrales bacterium]|nr:hypothetical protein [Candidatus Limnocylindrales bacterium]